MKLFIIVVYNGVCMMAYWRAYRWHMYDGVLKSILSSRSNIYFFSVNLFMFNKPLPQFQKLSRAWEDTSSSLLYTIAFRSTPKSTTTAFCALFVLLAFNTISGHSGNEFLCANVKAKGTYFFGQRIYPCIFPQIITSDRSDKPDVNWNAMILLCKP